MRDTFSVSKFVSGSCRFMVRRRVNTACERDELDRGGVRVRDVSGTLKTRGLRLVHVGRSDRSRLVTLVHQCHHIVVTAHYKSGQVFYVRAQAVSKGVRTVRWVALGRQLPGVLPHLKIAFVLGVEKVPDLLIVDLEERGSATPGGYGHRTDFYI